MSRWPFPGRSRSCGSTASAASLPARRHGPRRQGPAFLLGTSDHAAGKSERAEILAAHLAIHQTMLANEAMVGHVKALGWANKLKPLPRKSMAEEIARIDSRISRIKQDYGVDVRYKYSHDEFIPAVWHSVGEGTHCLSSMCRRCSMKSTAFWPWFRRRYPGKTWRASICSMTSKSG